MIFLSGASGPLKGCRGSTAGSGGKRSNGPWEAVGSGQGSGDLGRFGAGSGRGSGREAVRERAGHVGRVDVS